MLGLTLISRTSQNRAQSHAGSSQLFEKLQISKCWIIQYRIETINLSLFK